MMEAYEFAITATEREFQDFMNGRPWRDMLVDMQRQLSECHESMERSDITTDGFRQLQGVCAGIRKQMELPTQMLAQLADARMLSALEKGEEDANVQ